MKGAKESPASNTAEEKRAREEINACLRLSRGSLIKILPVVETRMRDGRYPKLVLKILLERIRQNQWDKLSAGDKCLVIQSEALLQGQAS